MAEATSFESMEQHNLEGDNNSANITAYQAQKCAALIQAYAEGQALDRGSLNTIAQFLRAAALEGSLGRGYTRPSSQCIWEQLDQLPWSRYNKP